MKYKIAKVYEVPGASQMEATDRLMEAFVFGVENDFHAYDVVRPSDGKEWARIDLRPPTGWLALLKEQLLGTTEKR